MPKMFVTIYENSAGKTTVVLPEVNREQLDAYILNLRCFFQDNDPISVRNISKIVAKIAAEPESKAAFEAVRSELNHFLKSPLEHRPKVKAVSNRIFLDAVIYGVLAHNNPSKRKQVKRWQKRMGAAHLESLFVTQLEQVLAIMSGFLPVVRALRRQLK